MKTRMTDEAVIALLQDGESVLNRARREFSGGCARIEQAGQQRTPLSPIEMRRMEFEAVERVAAVLRESDEPHELVGFLAVHADRYQRDYGLNGLHPVHYDLMKKYGARMVSFKRATNAPDAPAALIADERTGS